MHIKRIILFIIYLSILPAWSATAATNATTNSSTNTDSSGFKFSPIAHAHTAELLEFVASYGALETEKQKSIYLDVMQALAKDKSNIKLRVKHAAILALPNSNLRDTAIAQQHLQSLLEDSELSESNESLVKLLSTFILEHNTQSQKARDVAKKTEALKQKNKALEQKLNDLKNIEKTMIERNAKTNNKP
ncbi:MAG: hypothetical protein ACKE5M_07295 [Methylophilaceae bacterium]